MMHTHDMITDCDHGLAQQMLREWQNNNTPEINKLVKEFLDILDTVDEILVRLKEIVKENQ